MSEIDALAQAGWGGEGAEAYERGRPGYPTAAVELIGHLFGLGPGTTVLDLAAGTGKLTRELTQLGAEVIAVEPVDEMRAQLTAAVPSVEALEGTAERIPLPDGAVRAVTVAQAFHWFDVPKASAEIHRVLDADGGLAVLRNEWHDDGSVAWMTELTAALRVHSAHPAGHGHAWTVPFAQTGLFGELETHEIPYDLSTDRAAFLDRIASLSWVAAMDTDTRTAALAQVDAILDRHNIPAQGPFTVPNVTIVRLARRR